MTRAIMQVDGSQYLHYSFYLLRRNLLLASSEMNSLGAIETIVLLGRSPGLKPGSEVLSLRYFIFKPPMIERIAQNEAKVNATKCHRVQDLMWVKRTLT